jgi:hypothetical protein
MDLIHHNIGTPLKHNKYIFDIPIPFCHNLYLCNVLQNLQVLKSASMLFTCERRTSALIGRIDQSNRT